MAEKLDVVVTAGTANVTNPWFIPELRKTMDFSQRDEFTMLGVSPERVEEWRQLGFEVRPQAKAAASSPKRSKAKGGEEPSTENDNQSSQDATQEKP